MLKIEHNYDNYYSLKAKEAMLPHLTLSELLAKVQGGIGKKLTDVGTKYNLPELAPGGLGIQLQQAGAEGLTPEQRIQKSIENTGAIAEGDYQRAADMGLPYSASRTDGGILTNQQQTQNTTAVQDYLASQGVTDISTLNPVQQQQYDQLQAGAGGGGGGGINTDQARLDQLWNNAKATANEYGASGQRTFDTLMGSVNKFRDRAQTGFANAGQEITNSASELLGGNARTTQELTGTSRALGRAMGLGDSSKFNIQNQILGNLGVTQGSTLATKGENDRANSLALAGNMDTAQTNEDNANNYLKDINSGKAQIERGGLTDYTNLVNDMMQRDQALAAMNVGTPTAAPATDFSGILNNLNGGLLPDGSMGPTTNQNANPYNPIDNKTLLKKYAFNPYLG